MKTAFVNGYVFNSDKEAFVRANVICENGFITNVTDGFVPNGAEIIDISGKYLIPGLVDVHTHGIAGYDFNWADADGVKKMCHAYAKAGSTSVMATLASQSMSKIVNSIFAINPNRMDGIEGQANVLGIHMEGRYLNPSKKGAHNIEYLAKPDLKELETLVGIMLPAPMHFSVAPEIEGAEEFIKKAIDCGATIGIAHTNATYEQALEAVSWGATSFTHTFNAMTAIHHRMPGATVCALTTNQAYAEVICDGQHLHPAIVKLIYRAKPKDRMVLITDSMAATGSPDGEYNIAGSPVRVINGVATQDDGTLAGSTLTLFKAVTNLMSFCKIPLIHALRYATVNPAKMVGADSVGKIEKNYRADFIVISNPDKPEIDTVYVGAKKID